MSADDTTSFKVPASFWGFLIALVSWPAIVVLCLGMFSLAIAAAVIAAVGFAVLGIPVACVFWVVDRILS